jgi:hypothetical protein
VVNEQKKQIIAAILRGAFFVFMYRAVNQNPRKNKRCPNAVGVVIQATLAELTGKVAKIETMIIFANSSIPWTVSRTLMKSTVDKK